MDASRGVVALPLLLLLPPLPDWLSSGEPLCICLCLSLDQQRDAHHSSALFPPPDGEFLFLFFFLFLGGGGREGGGFGTHTRAQRETATGTSRCGTPRKAPPARQGRDRSARPPTLAIGKILLTDKSLPRRGQVSSLLQAIPTCPVALRYTCTPYAYLCTGRRHARDWPTLQGCEGGLATTQIQLLPPLAPSRLSKWPRSQLPNCPVWSSHFRGRRTNRSEKKNRA